MKRLKTPSLNPLLRILTVAVLGISAAIMLSACTDHRGDTTQQSGDDRGAEQAHAPMPPEPELAEARLSVPDMTCLMCPITVRKALEGVDGVSEAEVTLSDKTAVVWFDPDRTDTGKLIAAVAEAGFKATQAETDNE